MRFEKSNDLKWQMIWKVKWFEFKLKNPSINSSCVWLIPSHFLLSLRVQQIPFKIFWLLSASKPTCNWSKMTLKLSSYLLPKFSRVPFTIVLISGISTMVNGTLLNFGKRYEDGLRAIFDQWQKFHLGLDALSNQKILKGI